MLFRHKFSLGNIRDHVVFEEGGDRLELTVDESPARLVSGMVRVRDKMEELDKDATEEKANAAAMEFAVVIFGAEQANKILKFYGGNAISVLRICEQYFTKRLRAIIVRKQKKIKK